MPGMLIFAAILASPSIGATPALAPPACHQGVQRVDRKPEKRARPRKLNELPNASEYLLVLRHKDGCPDPVIVRDDIGSRPKGR